MRGLYACLLVWLMPVSSTQDFTGLSNVATDKTTCRVRPVSLREETSLTCYFPEDVSVSKKDFTVYHYLDSKRPVSVLDCLWLSGQVQCFTASGYEYNRLVSKQVTVRIPSVTLNQTGKYSCQISGSNPEDLEFCRLLLTSGKTSCQVPVVEPAADTNLTCYFPEDISLSQRDFAVYRFKDYETSELVVDCSWTAGEIKCAVQRGYQVDTKISDRVTVNIRQASQEQTGSYLCGLLGDRPDTSLPCSLQLNHLDNVLPERRAQESGHNTVATTAVIIVLAIATSVLLLWVVLRESLWRRFRCSQTAQERHGEENCTSRIKISRVLCSCTPPLTASNVDEGQHVQPVQRSKAQAKQGSTLSCPARLLAWSRRLRGRVPRNQVKETGETTDPLLRNLSHKQCEKTSNGDEVSHRTVGSDHIETGQGGFREADLSSLKQTPAVVPRSLQSESVVTAAVADDDAVDEISKDRKGERVASIDESARAKTMEDRSQPGDVSAADGQTGSTVINTDIDQETGKQGAQSASGTAHSPQEETPQGTPSNANGENQPRDKKTDTMGHTKGTLEENKLDMNPKQVNLVGGGGKDRKRLSAKKERKINPKNSKTNKDKGKESINDSAASDSDEALNAQIEKERAQHVSRTQKKERKPGSLRSTSRAETKDVKINKTISGLEKIQKSWRNSTGSARLSSQQVPSDVGGDTEAVHKEHGLTSITDGPINYNDQALTVMKDDANDQTAQGRIEKK